MSSRGAEAVQLGHEQGLHSRGEPARSWLPTGPWMQGHRAEWESRHEQQPPLRHIMLDTAGSSRALVAGGQAHHLLQAGCHGETRGRALRSQVKSAGLMSSLP